MKYLPIILAGCAYLECFSVVVHGWLKDRRRIRTSNAEANRLIDEYEAVHGAGTSGFKRFTV